MIKKEHKKLWKILTKIVKTLHQRKRSSIELFELNFQSLPCSGDLFEINNDDGD